VPSMGRTNWRDAGNRGLQKRKHLALSLALQIRQVIVLRRPSIFSVPLQDLVDLVDELCRVEQRSSPPLGLTVALSSRGERREPRAAEARSSAGHRVSIEAAQSIEDLTGPQQ
jgi:hypothetical protein